MKSLSGSKEIASQECQPRGDRPRRALFWMLVSALGFTGMAYYTKTLSVTIPQFELVFSRLFLNLIIVSIQFLAVSQFWGMPVSPFKSDVRLLIFRGVAGFCGVVCIFYTLSHLPISVSMLLSWCSPIFVLLFSWAFLKEKIFFVQLMAIGVIFLGLGLLLLSGEKNDITALTSLPLRWVLVGVMGSAFSGLAYMAVRAATTRVAPDVIIFYFSLVGAALALPLMCLNHPVWPTQKEAVDLLWMGLCGAFGQWSMTRGFCYVPAGVASSMSLLSAVFAALVDLMVFSVQLSEVQWGGVGVMAGGILVLSAYHPSSAQRSGE